jgi:PhnB protein
MSITTDPDVTTQKRNPSPRNVPALKVESYLFFGGRCEEALEFYRQALGAEMTALMRFKDSPDQAACNSVNGEKVMHASFRIGETMVMASDGCDETKPNYQGFALSLTVPNEKEARRCFDALAAGGQVMQALSQTFFARSFGMVTDRFGIMWMVIALP